MKLYAFSSNDQTNIWAGVGAGLWAVSMKVAINPGTIGKAKKLTVGSLGILYCSETHEFTTPFIVKSAPQERVIISNVWPQEWGLPFEIVPLGSPAKRLSKDVVAKELPSVSSAGKRWNKIIYVQPSFSFQVSEVTAEDWAYLFERLRT